MIFVCGFCEICKLSCASDEQLVIHLEQHIEECRRGGGEGDGPNSHFVGEHDEFTLNEVQS